VVSLQVLEHVGHPTGAVREIYRVLRPGGQAYIACENYLSFREQHYRVFWLPLLPKALGSLYLRARGRDPEFLRKHVRYTTFPVVLYHFLRAGFWSKRWPVRCASWPLPLRYAFALLILSHRMFRIGFWHLFRKMPDERSKTQRSARSRTEKT
jgi:SAM-dependent methyltransferase